MILQDLFENKLSDIHAAYQDYLRLGKSQERREQFKDIWGMDPDTWVRVHQDDVNKLTAHQQAQPVGDEHLRRGSAVPPVAEDQLDEKQDACYHKVKSRYKVWPSAYASGALVQCRKKGAANWGTGGKKKE